MNQIIHESMLYVVGQTQYVEGLLQYAPGVVPVCMYWRECLQGWIRINPGCSKMKQLGQDEAGEERKDRIRR